MDKSIVAGDDGDMTDVFDLSCLFRSSDVNTRKDGMQLTALVRILYGNMY